MQCTVHTVHSAQCTVHSAMVGREAALIIAGDNLIVITIVTVPPNHSPTDVTCIVGILFISLMRAKDFGNMLKDSHYCMGN